MIIQVALVGHVRHLSDVITGKMRNRNEPMVTITLMLFRYLFPLSRLSIIPRVWIIECYPSTDVKFISFFVFGNPVSNPRGWRCRIKIGGTRRRR